MSADRVVIESPLRGETAEEFVRNFRYLLWCCRAVWLKEGKHAIASHMLNPWFMDDTKANEREAGIENAWVWGGSVSHVLFVDLGLSGVMARAAERCDRLFISNWQARLEYYAPECWAAFERGDWPPHTPGFELARAES